MNKDIEPEGVNTHTPTPWYVDGTAFGGGPNEIVLGDCWGDENDEANAAFIVKAVNCHDELVRALEEIAYGPKFRADEFGTDAILIALNSAMSTAIHALEKAK